jgi:hypothetical protein
MPVKGMTKEEIDAATAAVVAAGGKSTDKANRLPGETASEANARITAGYKNQPIPELTQEGKAAGATMEFVRTGAGGVGTYKEIYPMGAAIPQVRTKANGNVFDPKGTLIPGSTPTTGATPATGTTSTTGSGTVGTASTSAGGRTQQLPPGFTPGAFPKELEKFFGQSPADIMGYKINEYTNAAGEKYYKLSISQKGAYGDALYGSSEFGAPIVKGSNGEWTVFQGNYSTGSNIGDGRPGGDTGTTGQGGTRSGNLSTTDPVTAAADAAGRAERQSAYDLLFQQFNQYGLGALVEPLKGLIISGASPAEFTIKLRESDAYKKRFSANQARIQKGLAAISEAEYLGLEDQYQNIMRNYGLPESYSARGEMGTQEGFNKFIANDVSAAELEDRIMTAQNRVINANPEVLASLKAFYPDITNGDILAYTLDPTKALTDIKRKVTAAEIGGAATQAGLQTGIVRAEELGAAGITKQQAQQGFGTIAGGLQRGSQLASIYGEDPYTQTTAEKEVFGLAGKTEAERERKKLTGLERATFSGQTGLTSGALARDRAGAY